MHIKSAVTIHTFKAQESSLLTIFQEVVRESTGIRSLSIKVITNLRVYAIYI